jgi:Tol biopolymer transport system component
MDVSGDVFTNDRLLLQQQGDENFYYPTFSPDSQWIAFNIGGYFSGTDSNGDPVSGSSSYANPTARLFLISASGGDPVELTSANGVGDLTNSWPRWAPVTQDYAWLAYSSKRDYGHSGEGNSQLWITAVDLSEASLGNDPSAPPVWFTGQDLGENNLIPLWVPRIAF